MFVVLVPPDVVTVMSTIPAEQAGEVAEICVAELTVKPGELVIPNFTVVAAEKFVPVMIIVVPPATNPFVGEMPVTVGADT